MQTNEYKSNGSSVNFYQRLTHAMIHTYTWQYFRNWSLTSVLFHMFLVYLPFISLEYVDLVEKKIGFKEQKQQIQKACFDFKTAM